MRGSVLSEGSGLGKKRLGFWVGSRADLLGGGDASPCSCQSPVCVMGLSVSDSGSVGCLPEQACNFGDMLSACSIHRPSPRAEAASAVSSNTCHTGIGFSGLPMLC